MHSTLVVSESVVYREIDDELVLIQLDSGDIFHFNRPTKVVLDFFRRPRSWATVPGSASLKTFCEFLLEENILAASSAAAETFATDTTLPPAVLLRKGSKKLDEIAFLSP